MKGIPEVDVVIVAERNDVCPAFDALNLCGHTRIVVHVGCAVYDSVECASRHAPDYAINAYRMRPAAPCVCLRVGYPRCAGWSDGFGSTRQ